MTGLMAEVLASPMMQAVERLIDKGKATGEFRKVDTMSAIMIIDAIMDRLYFEIPELTGMPGAMENPVWAREIRTFILAGLLTPERMATLLARVPTWAEGLPLAAAGFESYRYKKEQ